jgi:hypothetical protein
MIRRIEPNKRLSAAVVHGGIVYVSGQVPDTLHATVEVQTREILAKIDRFARRERTSRSHHRERLARRHHDVRRDEPAGEAWLMPDAPRRRARRSGTDRQSGLSRRDACSAL